MRAGGFQRGGSGAGATSLSAPLAAFFGSFLGGTRKEHYRTIIVYEKVCYFAKETAAEMIPPL